MRFRSLSLVALLLAASCLLAQAPAPATLRWAEGDPSSELATANGVQILVLHSPVADVAVHLGDLREYTTRAWVDILNRGQSAITVDPSKASLEIMKPKHKMLSPLDPDKLANSIKKQADVDAANRSGTGCTYMGTGCEQNASGVASSKEVQQVADAIVEDLRSTSWRVQTLKPGEQAHGAILFPFERKREECVVRIPVAGQVFEFPACRGGKK